MALSNVSDIGDARVLKRSDARSMDRAKEADRVASLALITNFIRLKAAGVADRAAGYVADDVNVLMACMACRVDAIGELHKIPPNEPKDAFVDLGEHLQKMCSAMQPLISLRGPMELACDPGSGCVVPAEAIAPIALIVSEMVTNAVKYAHPAGVAGRIDVGCQRDGSRIIVEVTDDGVGLPENFDVLEGGELGFKIVRALAAQLDALPIFDSGTLGLRFLLLLPKQDSGNS